MSRKSGILLHVTSLPSKYGIGNFGEEAYKFVDFLNETNQKILAIFTTWTNFVRRFAIPIIFQLMP